jgi:hypothetical protein
MTIHPLSRRGAPPTVTWTQRLGAAQSEAEIAAVVREYLALLSREEVAALPEACRPARIADAADISAYAFELVRHRSHDADVSDRVHRIAAVVTQAASRLSALHASQARPKTLVSRQLA